MREGFGNFEHFKVLSVECEYMLLILHQRPLIVCRKEEPMDTNQAGGVLPAQYCGEELVSFAISWIVENEKCWLWGFALASKEKASTLRQVHYSPDYGKHWVVRFFENFYFLFLNLDKEQPVASSHCELIVSIQIDNLVNSRHIFAKLHFEQFIDGFIVNQENLSIVQPA